MSGQNTWIVVANRGGLKIFSQEHFGQPLKLTLEQDHPEGRLLNQELKSDRPGASYDSTAQGRSTYDPPHQATEQVARNFAGEIAKILTTAAHDKAFAKLVLVCEPRFLGLLRPSLPKQVSALVTDTLDLDLLSLNGPELTAHLKDKIKLA